MNTLFKIEMDLGMYQIVLNCINCSFLRKKKLPIVVVRDVCPFVCLAVSVRLSSV